jgi:hypothetical protein
MPASRYVGEFVVVDKANGKQYVASKDWSWDRGDPLADWTLAGTTSPTLDADGKIDLFENSVAVNSSSEIIRLVAPVGPTYYVLKHKFRYMPDDTSTDWYGLCTGMSGWAGWWATGAFIRENKVTPALEGGWLDRYYGGGGTPISPIPPANVDREWAVIIAPDYVNFILDSVLVGRVYTGIKGSALGGADARPFTYMTSRNKYLDILVRHGANQVSHSKVWDFKFGRLVGSGEA